MQDGWLSMCHIQILDYYPFNVCQLCRIQDRKMLGYSMYSGELVTFPTGIHMNRGV
jgi:hypothetical protein